jgi:hypothetical protein
MAKLQPPAEHAAFVADLRGRFGRRRAFIKLLDEAPTPGAARTAAGGLGIP